LTEQGKAMAGLHDMIHEAISNQLTDKLSAEEAQQLTTLLNKALAETND
jgi:DNA-binding MarR family transcriptional regulator